MPMRALGNDADVARASSPYAHALEDARIRRAAILASTTLCILCAVCLLGVAGWRLHEEITWYLGNWQFGYLTFGRDLAHGTVFHHSALLDAIRDLLPERTDVLTQTYIWDHGKV